MVVVVVVDCCCGGGGGGGGGGGDDVTALETRISMIQSLRAAYEGESAQLEEIQALSENLEQWGVIGNPHTSETILSLRATGDALLKVTLFPWLPLASSRSVPCLCLCCHERAPRCRYRC
jgi:hypothetical protein